MKEQQGISSETFRHRHPYHLIEGLQEFQRGAYARNRDKWAQLAGQQHPSTLFITCADSRVDPSLLTQSGPGELFVCRNPGNLVPPYGIEDGGVATTAEYAIDVLHVRHAIVCGHSDCGAMRGLCEPEKVKTLPAVAAWLRYAVTAKRIHDVAHSASPDSLRILTEENILAQMTNLRTYPSVAASLAVGTLTLHGWYYDIGSGMVYGWDESDRRFMPLVDVPEAQPGPEHTHAY